MPSSTPGPIPTTGGRPPTSPSPASPWAPHPLATARKFTDGRSSWLIRRSDPDRADQWMVFDRPAGSERDLTVLAWAFDAVVVQRHPTGMVRVVSDELGVFRWEGFGWHREPPVSSWIDIVAVGAHHGDHGVLEAMLEFAVYDLGALGIGSTLIYRPDATPGPRVETRLPAPPPLDICEAIHLAPLRHALTQVDGAAVFDADGRMHQLGVRLVPSAEAEQKVEAVGGTRHTSGRRYSYDDPNATVIVVSENGPVSVFRHGELLGRSGPLPD